MPRQLLTKTEAGVRLLREVAVDVEADLQTLLRDSPQLLPLEDLDLVGPAMVVGKETRVASGAIDLVLVARGGELVLVEFKTGPKNPDYRAALAQVLDYGSDLWHKSLDEFERTVALRFYASEQSKSTIYHGCQSLDEGITKTWPDMTEMERAALRDRLAADVADGTFVFVIAAQRHTDSLLRTAAYLNEMHRRSRFAVVEVVRFTSAEDDSETTNEVFEARTVYRPAPVSAPAARAQLTHDALMEQMDDSDYARAIDQLLTAADANGLIVFWGSKGLSFRLRSISTAPPTSVGWFFPPGVTGWLNLKDLVLGADTGSASYAGAKAQIDGYATRVASLGGQPISSGSVRGWHFDRERTVGRIDELIKSFDLLRPEGD